MDEEQVDAAFSLLIRPSPPLINKSLSIFLYQACIGRDCGRGCKSNQA